MNDLLYSIGLDISDLKTSARATKEQAEDIKRGFKGFKDVIEFGGVGAAVFGFFKSVIEYAENLKGPLDENTAAVKRFGGTLTELKTTTLSWGAQFLGFFNRAGEGLGMLIRSAIDGTEEVKKTAQAEREAEAAIAAMAEEKKKNAEAYKKINEDLKKIEAERADIAFKEHTVQERLSIITERIYQAQLAYDNSTGGTLEKRKLFLELQQAELERAKVIVDLTKEYAEGKKKNDEEETKAAEEHIKLMDKKLQLQFEALTTDQKIAKLAADEEQITQSIARMKKEGVDTDAAEVALLETQADLGKLRKQQAEEQARAEKNVTEEIKDQTQAFADQSQIRRTLSQTTATKDYTDRQLQEKINNLRRQIDEDQQNLASGVGLSAFGNVGNPFTALMSEDLQKAQAELNYRQRFRELYSTQGERAFQQYSAFDEERLRNYIRPEDEKRAQLTLETLQDIQSRLAGTRPLGGIK